MKKSIRFAVMTVIAVAVATVGTLWISLGAKAQVGVSASEGAGSDLSAADMTPAQLVDYLGLQSRPGNWGDGCWLQAGGPEPGQSYCFSTTPFRDNETLVDALVVVSIVNGQAAADPNWLSTEVANATANSGQFEYVAPANEDPRGELYRRLADGIRVKTLAEASASPSPSVPSAP